MDRRNFLKTVAGVAGTAVLSPTAFSKADSTSETPAKAQQSSNGGKRPNILIITADDLTPFFLTCFGNKTLDISPNIDKFASQGLRFERAFNNASVCQPSRSTWITGRYPHRNGATAFNPITQPMPMLGAEMKKAGYYNGLFGKTSHYAPTNEENWDSVIQRVGMAGRDPKGYADVVSKAISNAQAKNKPFFIIANSNDPHRPFSKSPFEKKAMPREYMNIPEPSRLYKPNEVEVPGWLLDLPEMREELAYYYSSVKRFDDTVGAILSVIDSGGHRDDTIVMLMSDHGSPLPFAKGSVYRQSCHTPLIIRWPNVIKTASVDKEHFVNGIDVMPTILDIIGAPLPEGMDGSSYLPVLKGEKQPQRDHVNVVFHRAHTETFEQRGYHDAKYGYIYNEWVAWLGENKIKFTADNNIGMFGPAKDPAVAARKEFYLHRAPEELYDYSKDPNALHNLADDPAHAKLLAEMRAKMHKWMIEQSDTCETGYQQYLDRIRK